MTPTDATWLTAVRRFGHIARSVERRGDNPAGVVKLIASKERFLAMPATARIRLIQRDWWQIFQRPC